MICILQTVRGLMFYCGCDDCNECVTHYHIFYWWGWGLRCRTSAEEDRYLICKLNSVQRIASCGRLRPWISCLSGGLGLLQSCPHWFSIFQSSVWFSFSVTANSLSLCPAMFPLLYAKMKPLKYKTHSGRQFTICLSLRALSHIVSQCRSKSLLLNIFSPNT